METSNGTVTTNKHTIQKFIRENFKQRACNFYVSKTGKTTDCFCGRSKAWHESRNLPQGQPGETWSVDKSTVTRPCNTYGKIRMQGFSKHHQIRKPKYIRVDGRTTRMDKLWTLMTEHWKMPEPDLILSINGGTKRMNKLTVDLSNAILQGLYKVSTSLNTWIITGGVNVGVSQLIGKAAHDLPLQAQTDEKELIVIGVTSWGTVHNRQLLTNVRVRADGSLETKNYINSRDDPGHGQVVLEPNHTHFLFVDDGRARTYNTEVGFRFDLELSMAKKMEEKNKPSPVVQLLIEGGKRALMMVQSALGVKVPVVVVKGSYRCADLICMCQERTNGKEDNLDHVEKIVTEELNRFAKDMEIKEEKEHRECVECLKSICMEYRNKISIFDVNSSIKELDRVILMAILNNEEHNLTLEQQLKLTMQMGRWDLAKEILADAAKNKNVNNLQLDDLMMDALINNQPDFVDLFLEEGVVISHFLTKDRLFSLYEQTVISANPESLKTSEAFLSRLIDSVALSRWYHCCRHGLTHEVQGMCKISHLISELTDQMVSNFYKADDFEIAETMTMDFDDFDNDEDDENPQLDLRFSYIKDTRAVSFSPTKKKFPLPGIGGATTTDQDEALVDATLSRKNSHSSDNDDKEDKVIIYPSFPPQNMQGDRIFTEQDLFLWAILLKRIQLAQIFWRLGKDHISSALVAKAMMTRLSELATQEGELGLATEFQTHAKEFETLAVGSLSVAYSCGKSRTHILLCRSIPAWGNSTCMTLASQFSSMDFLHHTACQTRLTKIWVGAMPSATANWKILINIFFSLFLIRFIFPWVVDPVGDVKKTEDCKKSDVEFSSFKNTIIRNPLRVHRKRRYEKLMSGIIKLEPNFKQLSYFQAIINFYRAPVTKFYINILLYTIFLGVLTYFILVELKPILSYKDIEYFEYIVWLWCSTIIFQELRQIFGEEQTSFCAKVRDWFQSSWNKFDLVVTICFLLSVLLRYTLPIEHFHWSRMIYAFMTTMFYLRFLQFYFAHRSIGPKVVMVHKMMNDVVFFLCIYGVFVMAYGTLNQALRFPESKPSWSLLKNIVYQPYWQTYGELNLEHVEGGEESCNKKDGSCAIHSPLVIIAFAVFMLATNILLLNLLIAMFGNTFQTVQATSERVWAYNRYGLVQEFVNRPTAPPPFSIIVIIFEGIRLFFRWICPKKSIIKHDSPFVFHLHQDNHNKITQFEHHCMEQYCIRSEVLEDDPANQTLTRMDELMRTLNHVKESQRNIQEFYNSEDDDIGNNYNPLAPGVFLDRNLSSQAGGSDVGGYKMDANARLQNLEEKFDKIVSLIQQRM